MQTLASTLRNLTPDQWLSAYLNIHVYIKPMDGMFGIYAANGEYITSMPTRDAAIAAARLNSLEPLSLH